MPSKFNLTIPLFFDEFSLGMSAASTIMKKFHDVTIFNNQSLDIHNLKSFQNLPNLISSEKLLILLYGLVQIFLIMFKYDYLRSNR